MSAPEELLALAERCEAAEGLLVGEQAKALILEAWKLVNPAPQTRVSRRPDGSGWGGDGLGPYTDEYKAWEPRRKYVADCLAIGAFESAALTLCPEGSDWDLCSRVTDHWAWVADPSNEGRAATPALALTAAALRAHAGGAHG